VKQELAKTDKLGQIVIEKDQLVAKLEEEIEKMHCQINKKHEKINKLDLKIELAKKKKLKEQREQEKGINISKVYHISKYIYAY
jgi:proline dehydrogenase